MIGCSTPASGSGATGEKTIIEQLYDALIAAGSPEDKAREAARAVAGYDQAVASLRIEMEKLRTGFERLRARVDTLTWMVGFNIALSVAVLFRVFS